MSFFGPVCLFVCFFLFPAFYFILFFGVGGRDGDDSDLIFTICYRPIKFRSRSRTEEEEEVEEKKNKKKNNKKLEELSDSFQLILEA